MPFRSNSRTARASHALRSRSYDSGLAVREILVSADNSLLAASEAETVEQRYALSHLAALRAAAALVAFRSGVRRSGTGSRGGRPTSVWELLNKFCPELNEWSVLFAASAGKRAAAEAGVLNVVTARQADDLLRESRTFLTLATAMLESDGLDPCIQLSEAG